MKEASTCVTISTKDIGTSTPIFQILTKDKSTSTSVRDYRMELKDASTTFERVATRDSGIQVEIKTNNESMSSSVEEDTDSEAENDGDVGVVETVFFDETVLPYVETADAKAFCNNLQNPKLWLIVVS